MRPAHSDFPPAHLAHGFAAPAARRRPRSRYAARHNSMPALEFGEGNMRIGLVVDSACDLPLGYLEQHNVDVLPITVRIGEAVLADRRNEQATLEFLHAHVAERGHEAQTTPYTVQQIQDLFLSRLVIDYDYVFCMTI